MVLHYKCPNCGSDMSFDSTNGMLSCQSCGREDSVENYSESPDISSKSTGISSKTPDSSESIDVSSQSTNTFSEGEAMEYHCDNCGAILITDSDTSATSCSFCGAGVVLSDRLSGKLAPAKVIPFKISKAEAESAFVKWCRKGLLTPKGFMNANRIKSITGMYVPFWLFDLNSKADVEATCTKVRVYDQGDYTVTETKHYNVYRDINLVYQKVPADASDKMNDKLMDKLEPYYYDDLKDFKTPYLAGFIAEKYNSTDKDLLPRIKTRVEHYVNSFISSTINGYSSVNYTRKDIDTTQTKADYSLLPVWMVCYDYKQSDHIFAMNGQTGKIVGTPPLSKGKIGAWFAGVSISTLLFFKIIVLLMGGGLL